MWFVRVSPSTEQLTRLCDRYMPSTYGTATTLNWPSKPGLRQGDTDSGAHYSPKLTDMGNCVAKLWRKFTKMSGLSLKPSI